MCVCVCCVCVCVCVVCVLCVCVSPYLNAPINWTLLIKLGRESVAFEGTTALCFIIPKVSAMKDDRRENGRGERQGPI
jgi:hypothetical protein